MLMLEVPNGLTAEHVAMTEALAVGEHAVAGVGMETDHIEPLVLNSGEIVLRYVLGYTPEAFGASQRNMAEGVTRYASVITGVVSLDDTPDAFLRLQTDKSQIKIMGAPGK